MELRQRVHEFFRSSFYAPRDLREDESLLESGVVDSTGVLEIVAFLESELGIEVPDEEILPQNFETIGRICDYIERKLADAARAATG